MSAKCETKWMKIMQSGGIAGIVRSEGAIAYWDLGNGAEELGELYNTFTYDLETLLRRMTRSRVAPTP